MKQAIAPMTWKLVRLLRKVWDSEFLGKLDRTLELSILRKRDVYEWRVEIARDRGVKVGDNCRLYSMEFSSEPYLIEIGDHVVIGSHTQFMTHDGGTWIFDDPENMEQAMNVYGRIKIGNNVFIGIGCMILCNVEIGDNCVIGAGSVVRSDIPANSVVAGNPAEVLFTTKIYEMVVKSSGRMMRHHRWDPEKHTEVERKFLPPPSLPRTM